MTTESLRPGFLTCNQSPDFWRVHGGGRGVEPHGHMLLIHLHTDRQSGRVTTIPNTPVPSANPPPVPQLTPDDPCGHLLQGSGM
ncbi:hypothetical protein CgunFtcFv8_025025 [Champsocephalus gunnari]|uniref:Uncharacterized protein n=1 Tax=Champsocephalus gunnari TaxID=52237 RepID=A0AAN8HRD1_CHAGU|nr:hypothetical protein CgunFtcFv8_025025 [Champsocephalus gunnari]